MKILHIINTLDVGGAERLLTDALPIMKQAGHEVGVLLLNSSDSIFERQLSEQGIRVDSLNLKGGRFNPCIAPALMKRMKAADVLHAHLFPTQYWVALAHAASRSKALLVTTEHSTFNTRGRYVLTRWVDNKVYSLYDGIICISEGTADFMRNRVPRKVCVEVIENGVKLPSEQTVAKDVARQSILDGIDENVFLLLQVARFSEQKNQDCVIRALSHLPERVHVAFAGYGERETACRKLAEHLGVAQRVHFLGIRGDVLDLWKVADVGVMSSHWEGFGLAAVEGMAMGRPVLASQVKGLAEVVHHPELLFSPDDDEALARKVQWLMENEDERKRWGEVCRADAHQFSIERMVDRYLEFYQKLLSSRA